MMIAPASLGAIARASQMGAAASPTTSAVIINGVTPPAVVPAVPFNVKTSVAGVVLWLDGADPAATGTIPSAGATISNWVDKSGKGYTATLFADAVSTAPTYVANKSLQFTAPSLTGLRSPVPAQTFSNGLSLFVVFTKTTGVNANETLIVRTTVNTNGPAPFTMFGTFRSWGTENNAFYYSTAPNISSYTTQTILSITASTTLNWSENINGTNVGEYGPTNFAFNDGTPVWDDTGTFIYIGLMRDTGTRFTGQISEILAYNSVLSTPDRQKVEGYLAWKWGLQANLPANHPYKSATPTG